MRHANPHLHNDSLLNDLIPSRKHAHEFSLKLVGQSSFQPSFTASDWQKYWLPILSSCSSKSLPWLFLGLSQSCWWKCSLYPPQEFLDLERERKLSFWKLYSLCLITASPMSQSKAVIKYCACSLQYICSVNPCKCIPKPYILYSGLIDYINGQVLWKAQHCKIIKIFLPSSRCKHLLYIGTPPHSAFCIN